LEITEILRILDEGKDLKNWNGSINSLFDCLLQFLSSLEVPLFQTKQSNIKSSFDYLIEFLKDLLKKLKSDSDLSEKIIFTFCSFMIPDKQETEIKILKLKKLLK
jgi:CRISPR/Cas system CSM-associated protein Csm2 small subunit